MNSDSNCLAASRVTCALLLVPASPQLADVVKALNTLGATPGDLLAILQAIKAAGALNAELEVI